MDIQISQTEMQVIQTISILLVGLVLAKLAKYLIKKTLSKVSYISAQNAKRISSIIYVLFIAFILLIALDNLNININYIIATIGTLGITSGLIFKGLFSNLSDGVMLFFSSSPSKGDEIEIEGYTEKINKIGLFKSSMVDKDENIIIIPNNKFFSKMRPLHNGLSF